MPSTGPLLSPKEPPAEQMNPLARPLAHRCCFEDAVSRVLLTKLSVVPRLKAVLDTLKPKMLALHSREPTVPIVELQSESVEDLVARIQRAVFTGKGDKDTVIQLYKDYVSRIATALQKTLALSLPTSAPETTVLPPMPSDTTAASMREWHMHTLRAKHAHIADALSGKLLDTLAECVSIAIEGSDATGKALSVRDVAGLSAWLPSLRSSAATGVLLTAGPAMGKTWLMSQLIMHSLTGSLVPILIPVDRLLKLLLKHEGMFAAAANWVATYLSLTCEAPHYAMLREAMATRSTLLLFDGLDEAGGARSRIECHIAEVVAPQGHLLLCTSRPAGLSDCFSSFHKLQLSPLSDAQQQTFLATRLGMAPAAALKPYLTDKVPIDAETQRRVTANPCAEGPLPTSGSLTCTRLCAARLLTELS